MEQQQPKLPGEVMSDRWLAVLKPLITSLQAYHQHRVMGMHQIPTQGPVLVVVNHSLATYDIFLLATAIYAQIGRKPRFLGDRQIFNWPGLRTFATQLGTVVGTPDHAEQLLAAGELVIVAPGGMKEALRPTSEKYQLSWGHRRGFVRLAIKMGVPIILAACPRADDLYTVHGNKLTDQVYERLRFPLPLARGWGLSMVPRPVRLVHCLSEPLFPPRGTGPSGSEISDQDVEAFYGVVYQRMQDLMKEALSF